jgi:hypothetical protein
MGLFAIAARGETVTDCARDRGHRCRRGVRARLAQDCPRDVIKVSAGQLRDRRSDCYTNEATRPHFSGGTSFRVAAGPGSGAAGGFASSNAAHG